MELMVVTLIIGFLFSLLFIAPRFSKSVFVCMECLDLFNLWWYLLNVDQTEKVHSDANTKTVRAYNKAEVLLHNKRTDCWIIIKEKVYDVTSYVEEHPGGDAILVHAGDDSTEGFFGPQHATRVFDMIEDFYIGDLEK
ncbi:cytochrome b5, heme-binding site-containing protein [Cynara cardunculus var. scolymus]|uniref:Cytochrome b5, heme-binding site-containing protein n=1 Tax=Cynara cardunculus var. scolymus TaxID=59895 RepID=A0A103YEL4_CYNCS|nr:cytochrome b5, heme-binding site-containing protein [Cynara cardunculus var. scolymus]